MAHSRFIQDGLALMLAGILAASFTQLAGPWGIPIQLTGAIGAGAALAVLVARARDGGRSEVRRHPIPSPGRRSTTALLTLIILASFALRAYQLMDKPAWEDEMWTLRNMYTSDWIELLRVAAEDYWPPLHYLILNTLARIGDTGLLWLRSPSVVFGVATVGLVGWVGMRFFGSRVAGLASAAMLAGATTHVLYSQEARVYALLIMLTVLSSYFFLKSHAERRISPAYVGVTTLMVYSHSFVSWYFIAAQSVFVLLAWIIWRDGKAFLKGFLSQVLVLALWIPLIAAFLWARAARGIVVPTQWATGAESRAGPLAFVELYQGLAVRSWAGAAFMALLMTLAALPVFTRASPDAIDEGGDAGADRNRMSHRRVALFLCCWITVPLLFSFGVTWFTSLDTFGEIRYHLPVLPGIFLFAGGGFLFLRSREAVAMAVAIVVLLPIAELPRYYRDFDRPAVDEVAEIVRENEFGSETFYIGNSFRVFQYYYRGFFPRIGSERWDSLTAAHAHQTDRYTTFDTKWGDTYAYEKMTDRITFLGYGGPEAFAQTFRDELDRGGFTEPYWVIFQTGLREEQFLAAYEEVEVPCTRRVEYRPRGMFVWHCRGPADPVSADSAAAPGQSP